MACAKEVAWRSEKGTANMGRARMQESGADDDQSDEAWGSAGTTVMLRNIPNKYTRDMLIKRLNMSFEGQFDFLYLPIDFRNKCNVGYCFINFRSLDAREC